MAEEVRNEDDEVPPKGKLSFEELGTVTLPTVLEANGLQPAFVVLPNIDDNAEEPEPCPNTVTSK